MYTFVGNICLKRFFFRFNAWRLEILKIRTRRTVFVILEVSICFTIVIRIENQNRLLISLAPLDAWSVVNILSNTL